MHDIKGDIFMSASRLLDLLLFLGDINQDSMTSWGLIFEFDHVIIFNKKPKLLYLIRNCIA